MPVWNIRKLTSPVGPSLPHIDRLNRVGVFLPRADKGVPRDCIAQVSSRFDQRSEHPRP